MGLLKLIQTVVEVDMTGTHSNGIQFFFLAWFCLVTVVAVWEFTIRMNQSRYHPYGWTNASLSIITE